MVSVHSLSFIHLPLWNPFIKFLGIPLQLPINYKPISLNGAHVSFLPSKIEIKIMQDSIGIPACFSAGDKPEDSTTITKSGQSVFMSVYKTNIADQCRLITVTWCKNLLLHGLSVSIEGPEAKYACKVELKPWNFWRKQGSKSFLIDGTPLDIFWDLKSAKFHGETEPISEYYVAVVSGEEVVLVLGDMKKDAYRKTGCRPSLIDPVLVSRTEHVYGKKKFQTRVKLRERGGFHEVSIECMKRNSDIEMEIRIDGDLVIHVKHLQWKFRGNELIYFKKATIEVYWDVHDWLFSPGCLRHALFIIKPSSLAASPPRLPPVSPSPAGVCLYEFCLFLYAWKVE
ncbi:hypothetical protein HanXRQr2_Chr02g0051141 [Helianthus annuus]|uniref:DUF868 family protein n=2 Tax=Helianthus annuus TaxID=4232 RepID=A0A251VD56_HELAN|nr:hypothetical protein HanXRQr2_Chr02g0051141 [Helianthus annuus]KAJ0603748.1 hypothetical protein HanHA300_Chr02g0041751 [Helianthus annuus]KAJ0617715.1 hypothetical protein HanHA89_Chr02g0044911 [Helianthus annuus]KAJ0776254.1 hypothetical protein HanLR1_Chr02g0043471 [Helianthus annuus]KAJ0950639.1 hypothetical protein HanPSC8_Chr02g0050561 [Helianthus annuus]